MKGGEQIRSKQNTYNELTCYLLKTDATLEMKTSASILEEVAASAGAGRRKTGHLFSINGGEEDRKDASFNVNVIRKRKENSNARVGNGGKA